MAINQWNVIIFRYSHLQSTFGRLVHGEEWTEKRTHVLPSMTWGMSKQKVRNKLKLKIRKLINFTANLNVVYKPDCFIKKEVRERVLYLKCEVEAFPPNVTYYWYHNEDLISCRFKSKGPIFDYVSLFWGGACLRSCLFGFNRGGELLF